MMYAAAFAVISAGALRVFASLEVLAHHRTCDHWLWSSSRLLISSEQHGQRYPSFPIQLISRAMMGTRTIEYLRHW
jgi:hypothetical protein